MFEILEKLNHNLIQAEIDVASFWCLVHITFPGRGWEQSMGKDDISAEYNSSREELLWQKEYIIWTEEGYETTAKGRDLIVQITKLL